MTFTGTAEHDLEVLLSSFPRDFTLDQAVEMTGWETKKARQAIVMGLQEDRLLPREILGTSYRIYENVSWRREWVTKRWAA